MTFSKPTRNPSSPSAVTARRQALIRRCAAAAVGVAAGATVLVVGCRKDPPAVPPPPPTQPVAPTRPATASSADAGPPVRTYLQAVRAAHPGAPSTRPVEQALSLSEAARVRLPGPVHLDHQGHLWISHGRGDPVMDVLAAAVGDDAPTEHVSRDRVLLAAWFMDGQNDGVPHVVVPAESGDGRYELASVAAGRRPMGTRSDYRWDRATVWDAAGAHRFIVPTAHGVSVFTVPLPRGDVHEAHQDLAGAPPLTTSPAPLSPLADPHVMFDSSGLLAWIPAGEAGHRGGGGVWRFVDGRWWKLAPSDGFPDDGTVAHILPPAAHAPTAVLTVTPAGGLAVSIAALEPGVRASQSELAAVAAALVDPATAPAAAGRLDDYGPGAWVRLARDRTLPSPVRAAVDRRVTEKARQLFGTMTLRGDGASIVCRMRDGGALLYAPEGVIAKDGASYAPAWIALKPGSVVDVLPANLTSDFKIGKATLDTVNDQWVATTDGFGPRLYMYNAFRRLLRKDERPYSEVVGVDRRGRWVFRKPPGQGQEPGGGPTLIIDPMLLDFDGRLPAFTYFAAETFGWDRDGWPAVVLPGGRQSRLGENGWQPLPKGQRVLIDPNNVPPPSTKPAASTRPAGLVRPGTQPSPTRLAELGTPLLVDSDGTRFFGGVETLTALRPDGTEVTWQMPSEAAGFSPPAYMVRAGDGRLYLFNLPGRALRLKETYGESEPFAVERAFKKGLPDDDTPIRVWTDPAGRICLIVGQRVIVLFPQGYIPREIRDIMAGGEDDDGVTPVEPDGIAL